MTTPASGDTTGDPTTGESGADDFDRQRRRVLWALPTGLYLIGSRFEEQVNLMTANLVVQVCLEPKLVAAAIETESVTAGLIAQSHFFSVSLLERSSKEVVRRFVKPVADIDRDDTGEATALNGHAVKLVADGRVPVLASAAGYIACALNRREELGSHTLFIGEVAEVGGEPAEVLRMEDTRMHYGG
jgi:flavin reductase (DIM6/NTAB) family NADH-FMN oxidoreductase RutF